VNEKENFEKVEKKDISANLENVDVDKLEAQTAIGETAREISADAMKTIDSTESTEGDKTFSEKGNDKKDYSDSTSGATSDDDAQNLFAYTQKTVPIRQMKKKVEKAIRAEIRKEEQKVLLAYVGLKKYSPNRLAEKIAKIRSLKDLLSSLISATKEFLTGLYLKWVQKKS